jgi:hypothetical protein
MNITSLITANYEIWTLGHIGQTNPIQTQSCPNLLDAKINVSAFNTMNYEQRTMNCLTKTNPNKAKQTQLVVSRVEPPVVPVLPALSIVEGSLVEGSRVEPFIATCHRQFFPLTPGPARGYNEVFSQISRSQPIRNERVGR